MSHNTNKPILYADIVGYTKLLRSDREDALQKLARFKTQIRTQVEAYGGKVLQIQRDNCLAQFELAGDAVACAEELQRLFQTDKPVPVRMGIHVGEVVIQDGQAFGEDLLALTQLERIGDAGSIVLSEDLLILLPKGESYPTEPLGTCDFTQVETPVRVYALAKEGLTVPKPKQEINTTQDDPKRRRWFRAAQLFAGYLVAAWTLLQFVDWVLTRYQISPYWTDILLWTFLGIIPSLLIYLVHQERFHQRKFLRREKVIIPMNVLFLFGGLTVSYGGVELGSITKTVSFTDIDGSTVTETIIKPEFVREIGVFPFTQEGGADSTQWIGISTMGFLGADMNNDKYLGITVFQSEELEMEKINRAKLMNGDYYIDGRYRVREGSVFEITPALRDKRNGSLVRERTFRGTNYFRLIDSMSVYLRQEIGLSPQQMAQSVDLRLEDWATNNLEALKQFSLGMVGNGAVHFEKAIELDSTFVGAALQLAARRYNSPRGQLEARHYAQLAMKHRKKAPFELQVLTALFNYQLENKWDKAETLINLQLETQPNNANLVNSAINFYRTSGQLDKAYELQKSVLERFPSLRNQFTLLFLMLRKGQLDQVIKEVNVLLKQYPQQLALMDILVNAYMQKREYNAAREVIEQMMVIDPDQEKTLALYFDAIDFLEKEPDNLEQALQDFAGYYRAQLGERVDEITVSNGAIYARTIGTSGWYTYPSGKNRVVHGGLNRSLVTYHIRNDQGDIIAALDSFASNTNDLSSTNYIWKQDSMIWQAEELLRARRYDAAATAYAKAIAAHPEHFYLYEAQEHITFMQSKTEEEIKELYQRYVGNYGEVRIWIEGGELYYDRPGLARRIFRPVSDTEFITLFSYGYKYGFEVEAGEVQSIYMYEYNNETEAFELDEDWSYARTELKN